MYGFNTKKLVQSIRTSERWHSSVRNASRQRKQGRGDNDLYSSLNQFISQLSAEDDC